MTVYNSSSVYESEIRPLVSKMHRICALNGIPMFVAVAVSGNEKETVYESDIVSPATRGIELRDDLFPEFLFLVNSSGRKVRQRWESK